MIKHIVMWKLKEEALGNDKLKNAKIIKDSLEALTDICEGVNTIEVGIDILQTEQSYDVVLVSVFENKNAYKEYAIHPEHQKIVPFIKEVTKSRIAVDY